MKKVSLLLVIVFLCELFANSQGRIPMLGETAPSFKANSTNGKINFPDDFGNSWKILFSHPQDFTPVCTSEILQLATMQKEFESLNVKIAVLSTDDLASHQQWKQLMEDILKEKSIPNQINFPIIDDENALISNKYGMLHAWTSKTKDVRGVFILDPDNKIQSINFYPMNIGRNMEEIQRVVIALQTSKEEEVLIPVNWKVGDDVLMKYAPYSESDLAANPDLGNQYYKVGVNMWYKRDLEK